MYVLTLFTEFFASQVYFDAVDRSTGRVVDESLIFNIRIRDVNDHAPQFPEKEFNVSVKESQAAGVLGVFYCVSTPAFALDGSLFLPALISMRTLIQITQGDFSLLT